jgi:COP9 signalosome complex subunit 3
MKNGQHLDNVLETLDLQQHSLGVLAVLCVKFSLPAPSATPDHHELLFAQVQEFITGCNGEQVRFAPDTCKPTLREIFVILMYVIYMKEYCNHVISQS